MPVLPSTPPSSRYGDSSIYGFWMEFPESDQDSRAKDGIDAIVSSEDYVELALSPQQISMDEPLATGITFTQGGGKFVESRGGLIKSVIVSGTTGYIPPSTNGSKTNLFPANSDRQYRGGLVDSSLGAEMSRAERSGFKAFYDLRQLFRRFGHERRLGNQVVLHYCDFKGDEFWQIEPQNFSLRRTSRSPFTYNYEIRFSCLEPSASASKARDQAVSLIASAMRDLPSAERFVNGFVSMGLSSDAASFSPDQPISSASAAVVGGSLDGFVTSPVTGKASFRSTLTRYREMTSDGINGLKLVSGTFGRTLQDVLNSMGTLVQFFDDVGTTKNALIATPIVLLNQLEDSIAGAYVAMGSLYTPEQAATGIISEWNEFLHEVRTLGDHMTVGFDKYGDSYSNRVGSDVVDFSTARTSGSATDLIPETGNPLKVNPFVGVAGLELVANLDNLLASDGFRSVVVFSGESIYDVARRCLGSVHRFVELVMVNDLTFPFIVGDASNKPPGTIAWGEWIKIPIQTGTGSEAAVGPPACPVPTFGGKVSATGTTSQVIDSDAQVPWRDGQWIGYTIALTSGGGTVDPERIVVDNTADTITVNRPWSVSPTVGDSFTLSLIEFQIRVAPTPDQIAFGRDILLKFDRKDGTYASPFRANIVLNAFGDIATVSGQENWMQAISILFATPVGSHPFHRLFGCPLPIGRPFTGNLSPLYTYFVRQSLLNDPRTQSVKNAQLSFENGALSYQAQVQPVNSHKAKQVNLTL